MHALHHPYWTVIPAPEPHACVWRNMHVSEWEHWLRKLLVHIPTFLIVVAYGIPILLVAGLLSLHNLEDILPFIKALTRNKAIHDILQVLLLSIQFFHLGLSARIVEDFLPVQILGDCDLVSVLTFRTLTEVFRLCSRMTRKQRARPL